MPDLVLELCLPMSGTIVRDCASLPEAIAAATAYYAGFPSGWAEIRDSESGHVVMGQEALRAACGAPIQTSSLHVLRPARRRG